MTEEQLEALHEISILLGKLRKVSMEAAVIRTKYKGFEVYPDLEKNDDPSKKNKALMKKILEYMDVVQDASVMLGVKIRGLCKELDPEVNI